MTDAWQSSKLSDEVQLLGGVLGGSRVERQESRARKRKATCLLLALDSRLLSLDSSSPECGGFARDPAKVEDQVRFLARTLESLESSVESRESQA